VENDNKALQSRTGKYRGLQGKPCNENRIPAMRTGFPVMKTGLSLLELTYRNFHVSSTGFWFAVWMFDLFNVSFDFFSASVSCSLTMGPPSFDLSDLKNNPIKYLENSLKHCGFFSKIDVRYELGLLGEIALKPKDSSEG
jgi:hypothetical protein